MMDRVERFLAHYASPYYDPQKAHDYYEQHKVASAKNAGSALTSKEQRDTFAVAKSNIDKTKVAEVTSDQNAQVARLKALSDKAQASSSAITANLNKIAESLNYGLKTLKVNEIPANATPKERAFIEQQNRILKAKAAQDTQAKIRDAAGQATRDRAKVATDLQSAITTARKDYQAGMVALQTKYQNITQTEKQNIHDQVAGAPPKVAKVIKAVSGAKAPSRHRGRSKKH